jgi:hypothetical protein
MLNVNRAGSKVWKFVCFASNVWKKTVETFQGLEEMGGKFQWLEKGLQNELNKQTERT